MPKRPLSAQFSVAASIYGVLSSGQRGSARVCVCAHTPVRQYRQEWKGKEKVQNDQDVVLPSRGLHSGGGARVSTVI